MDIRKGDYVLIRPVKKWLGAKVVGIDGSKLQIKSFDKPHIDPTVAECKKEDVLVNLGKSPESGKVYGVDFTHIYHGHTTVPKLDVRVNWFYLPEKDQKNNVYRAMRIVHKKLSAMKLSFLLDNDNSVWEIQGHKTGKYCGRYIHPKDKLSPGRIQLCPNVETADYYPYMISHELGHRMHLRYATETNARWIKLFVTSVKIIDVEKSEAKRLLGSLVDGELTPSKFGKALDDEQKLCYKWILRFIKSSNNVSVRELDDLFRAHDFDDIKALWPNRSIPRKELTPVLTEYATKNFRELIAESFAYYVTGKKLPKNINNLIEKTVTIARHNYKHPD